MKRNSKSALRTVRKPLIEWTRLRCWISLKTGVDWHDRTLISESYMKQEAGIMDEESMHNW